MKISTQEELEDPIRKRLKKTDIWRRFCDDMKLIEKYFGIPFDKRIHLFFSDSVDGLKASFSSDPEPPYKKLFNTLVFRDYSPLAKYDNLRDKWRFKNRYVRVSDKKYLCQVGEGWSGKGISDKGLVDAFGKLLKNDLNCSDLSDLNIGTDKMTDEEKKEWLIRSI